MFRARFLSSSQVSDWHNNALPDLRIPGRAGSGPATVPGLQFWLSADAEPGYADEDSIATWTDRSGNGRNFTGADAQWLAGRAPGGGPAIGSATASPWTMQSSAFMAGSSGEIFMYVKFVNSGNNNLLSGWGTDTQQSHWQFGGRTYEGFGSTARKDCGPMSPFTYGWEAVSIYSAASDWGVYRNDSVWYSTTSNTVAWAAVPHVLGGSSGRHLMAEVFGFNRKLSADERSAMFTYLSRHG